MNKSITTKNAKILSVDKHYKSLLTELKAAEYALRGIEKPIGISEYKLTKVIPEDMKSSLPTIEEIETELNKP